MPKLSAMSAKPAWVKQEDYDRANADLAAGGRKAAAMRAFLQAVAPAGQRFQQMHEAGQAATMKQYVGNKKVQDQAARDREATARRHAAEAARGRRPPAPRRGGPI